MSSCTGIGIEGALDRPRDAVPVRLFRLLSSSIVFLALIQVLVVLSGLLRIPICQVQAIAILGAGLVAALLADRWVRRDGEHTLLSSSAPSVSTRGGLLLGLAALFALAGVVVNASLHPYMLADCAIYHLPTIHFWSEAGYVHWVDVRPEAPYYQDMFLNGYPKAAEIIGFVLAHGAQTDAAAHLLNLPFLSVGCFGTSYIARRLGASTWGSILAGALFGLVPVNVQQVNGTYVDSAFSSSVVAFLALLLHVTAAAPGLREPRWSTVVVLGASAGLVVGIKSSGMLVTAMVALVGTSSVLFGRWMARRGANWKEVRSVLVRLAAVIAVALLVGGYWYIRNALHTGNPIYPMRIAVGGLIRLQGWELSVLINEKANYPYFAADWSDWRLVALNWLQGGLAHWPWSVCSVSGRLGGLGLLWPLGCLPAMAAGIWVARRRRVPRQLVAGFLGVLTAATLIFVFTPMHWWARYTAWLMGIGLPCLVVVFEESSVARYRVLPRAWATLLIAVLTVETVVGVAWVACAIPGDWYGGLVPFPERTPIRLGEIRLHKAVAAVEPAVLASVLEESENGPSTVWIGPMDEARVLSPNMMDILGSVCDPLGRRRIRFVSLRGVSSLLSALPGRSFESGAYLLWDGDIVLPEELREPGWRHTWITPQHLALNLANLESVRVNSPATARTAE